MYFTIPFNFVNFFTSGIAFTDTREFKIKNDEENFSPCSEINVNPQNSKLTNFYVYPEK